MSAGDNINDDRDDVRAGGGGTAQGQGTGHDPTGPLGGQDDAPMPDAPSSPDEGTSPDDEVLTDGDDGYGGDETMDAAGGDDDSFSGGGHGDAAAPFGTAAGASLVGGVDVVGVVGIAGTTGGGSVVLNGLLNEEPPTPPLVRAPGTRRRYNPDKYLPSGRLRPSAETGAGRGNLGTNLVTDVQALRSRRSRWRSMTFPGDGMSVEEAELLAAAASGDTNAHTSEGGGGDGASAPNPAPAGGTGGNEAGEAAASRQEQQEQQQPRRSRRRHSSSPTRFSVERHSGVILEDLIAAMGLDEGGSSSAGSDGAGPSDPWGESQ